MIKESSSIHNQLKPVYLTKQSRLLALSNGAKLKHIPDETITNVEANVKSLIFSEAINCLQGNPKACLVIANSILDFFPHDGASLQLKGEALAELKRIEQYLTTQSF